MICYHLTARGEHGAGNDGEGEARKGDKIVVSRVHKAAWAPTETRVVSSLPFPCIAAGWREKLSTCERIPRILLAIHFFIILVSQG